MSTIIKATDHNRAVHSVAFNLDDVRTNAEEYLTKIREQAGNMLLEAKQQCDAIRARAEQEGRRAAEATVDHKLDERMQAVLATLLPAIQTAIHELQQTRGAWLAQWERQVVHLAAGIAQRIIRRELAADPQLSLPLIRESLELAAGGGRVRLLLNPQDHAALGVQVQRLVKELSRLGPTEIVADPAIGAGGCRVETAHGAIDHQLDVQLRRIEQELT